MTLFITTHTIIRETGIKSYTRTVIVRGEEKKTECLTGFFFCFNLLFQSLGGRILSGGEKSR